MMTLLSLDFSVLCGPVLGSRTADSLVSLALVCADWLDISNAFSLPSSASICCWWVMMSCSWLFLRSPICLWRSAITVWGIIIWPGEQFRGVLVVCISLLPKVFPGTLNGLLNEKSCVAEVYPWFCQVRFSYDLWHRLWVRTHVWIDTIVPSTISAGCIGTNEIIEWLWKTMCGTGEGHIGMAVYIVHW